jgi:hypothetical protein
MEKKEAVSKVKFVTLSEVEMSSGKLEMAFDSAQADNETIYETAYCQVILRLRLSLAHSIPLKSLLPPKEPESVVI